jgi:Fic family protein
MMTFLLFERQALQQPVLYLSHYFKTHRSDYYERLQAVRDNGDWEGWLSFFLDGVAEVSREAAATAKSIVMLREDHRRRINDRLGRMAGDGNRVLDQLYERPIVSVDDVRGITKTTFQAANMLIARMTEAEILKEMTGRARNRRFLYAPYVALFNS